MVVTIAIWSNYCDLTPKLDGGNSNIFYVHPYSGEMIQFDEHVFQRGWFNHPLEKVGVLVSGANSPDYFQGKNPKIGEI